MENNRKRKFSFFMFIFLILFICVCAGSCKSDGNPGYELIVWSEDIYLSEYRENEIRELNELSYDEIIDRKPLFIINSKQVLKYYWDEQFLLVDFSRRLKKDIDQAHPWTTFFTIALNREIILHGYNYMHISAAISERDKSYCPVFEDEWIENKDCMIIIIKPYFKEMDSTFRDLTYDEKQAVLIDEG